MQIADGTKIGKAVKMSAWPRSTRPFTEPISATEDKIIGPGRTLPDLIRLYYKGAVPVNIQGSYGFLDRDNKEREYVPQKEDKYVFKSMASLGEFSAHAHELLGVIVSMWESLGLPTKEDKDRAVTVPDTDALWGMLDPAHPSHSVVVANRDAIMFMMANADIVKKSCVVRSITAGWWAVSYAGKTSTDKTFFDPALKALKSAMDVILKSPKFKKIYEDQINHIGFPMDTNPGYPFFSAEISSDGTPVSRIKSVELFKDLVSKSGHDWDELLRIVDQRAGKYGMPGFPFAIFPIRRLQPGFKYSHQFTTTAAGLITSHDERGQNSQRVAWAVSYIYNVLMVPFLTIMKSMQLILPGLFHDGESKTHQMARLSKMSKAGKLFIAEADYSNYDRFIPVDIWKDIASHITNKMQHPRYWDKLVRYLHDDASLIWPDYSSSAKGNGWVFKPGLLGLLSGVAATTQSGTYVNAVVNLQSLMNAKKWNHDQAVSYLTQYLSAPHGSGREYFGVQSDDTILIAESMGELKSLGDAFLASITAAGLKGAVEFGDRFLMRHLQDGGDRPVPARVWQNTLSNETAPANEYILLAGLASRTDGLAGFKTVDPFLTGTIQKITFAEAHFTFKVVHSLLHFMSTSKEVSATAVRFLKILESSLSNYSDPPSPAALSRKVEADRSFKPHLDKLRRAINIALAEFEIERMKVMDKNAYDKWLYQLFKDRNVPSQSAILTTILADRPELAKLMKGFEAKEHAFLMYSMQTIGVQFDDRITE